MYTIKRVWSKTSAETKKAGKMKNLTLLLKMLSFFRTCMVYRPKYKRDINTVSIHCAPEMSEIDCIGRIESFWPKFVRGW